MVVDELRVVCQSGLMLFFLGCGVVFQEVVVIGAFFSGNFSPFLVFEVGLSFLP